MQRTINTTPEKLFAEATAFMVNAGATIVDRSENSITFSAKQGIGTGDYLMGGLVSLFDLGAAMAATTTHAVAQDQRSTLVAIPAADEGTAVTIPDNEFVVDNLLRFWFVANVLRESLPNPMQQIKASYHKMLIWNDRVEAHSRILFWGLDDTIKMEDVAGVDVAKRRFTVRATDGREITVKAVARDDARWAAELIKARLERVMNLGENRIEMRIARSAWFPRDLRFPHS